MLQSTGKGQSTGVSNHRSPITDEPCSAWQALYHCSFIAPYCMAPPGPARTLLPSRLSPVSLSAGILNPPGLPRRNCCCSITRCQHPLHLWESGSASENNKGGIMSRGERRLKTLLKEPSGPCAVYCTSWLWVIFVVTEVGLFIFF